MADNVVYTTTVASPPDATNVATRLLTLSGDSTNVQVIVPIAVTGSEGSWTGREWLVADDAAFTPGTNAVAMVGAEFDDSSPDSVDEGDAGALRMSSRRELYVQIRDAAGNERGLNIDASGRLAVTWAGTAPPIGAGTEAAALRVTVATDSTGVLSVDDNGGALTVDNAGTFAVQVDGNALTSLQLIDDTVVVLGTATYTETSTKANVIGAVRRDADTTAVNTDNEIAPLIVDANGYLKVEIFDGGASHTVDNNGTFVVQENGAALTALQLIDDGVYTDDTSTHATGTSKGYGMMAVATPTDGSVDANDFGHLAMSVTRRLHVSLQDFAGTAPVTGSGTATGALRVELPTNGTGVIATVGTITNAVTVNSHAVTNAGTFAVQAAGDVAHDSGDSGSPVKTGFKAIDIGANPTDVTANDRSQRHGLRNGVPWILGGAPNIINKQINVTDADGAQTDTALVTVAAGTAIVVTALQVMCDGANSGDVGYRIGFGTANVPANDANAGILSSHPGVKPGSGVVVGNGSGVIGMGASNEDLRLTCEDPVGGAIDVTVSYFTITIG